MDNRVCGLKLPGSLIFIREMFILTLKVDLHGCSVNTWGCRALAASVLDINNEGTHHGVAATTVVRFREFADFVSRYRKFLTKKKRSHEHSIYRQSSNVVRARGSTSLT